MLQSGKSFTAVLAFDDLTALGVVRGLTEGGVRVPQDCSVTGFDDVLPAEVATPAITTIRQPLREMGVEAAERVLQAIKSGASSPAKARLHKTQPELIVRMSTAPPAKQGRKETSR
jgi:LacI family transcriptional regulator